MMIPEAYLFLKYRGSRLTECDVFIRPLPLRKSFTCARWTHNSVQHKAAAGADIQDSDRCNEICTSNVPIQYQSQELSGSQLTNKILSVFTTNVHIHVCMLCGCLASWHGASSSCGWNGRSPRCGREL